MKKTITKTIATLDEFSLENQKKIYNKEMDSYIELATEPLNIEMKNVLSAFLHDYDFELSLWNVDEYKGYEYRIKRNDILFSLHGKSLRAYVSEKYKEVQGYISMYADNHLIDCIKEYIDSKEDIDFQTLMKRCLNKFFESWQTALSFYTSFQHFKDDAIANNWYYNTETLQFEE